jgi:hypothetical protein
MIWSMRFWKTKGYMKNIKDGLKRIEKFLKKEGKLS